jgi:hypothetical protein
MKARCMRPTKKYYENYGVRGISICSEWNEFITFRDWALKNGYKKYLTIDRINNNGNYEPYNCRWITKAENNKNKARIITSMNAEVV